MFRLWYANLKIYSIRQDLSNSSVGKGNCGIQATLANRNGLSFTLGNLWASYLQIYNLPRVNSSPLYEAFQSPVSQLYYHIAFQRTNKVLGTIICIRLGGCQSTDDGHCFIPLGIIDSCFVWYSTPFKSSPHTACDWSIFSSCRWPIN